MSQSNQSNSNFDLNYLAPNQPSMCIPRVFENINELQVREVFEQLDLLLMAFVILVVV